MLAENWLDLFVGVLLATFGGLGIFAAVRPRRFAEIATWSSRWIDSNKYLAVLDKQIDIDSLILPYSRALGALVLLSTGVLAFLYWTC